MEKKRYNYPIKKKKPIILLLNSFGRIIIPQFLRFVNMFNKIQQICIMQNYLTTFFCHPEIANASRGLRQSLRDLLFRTVRKLRLFARIVFYVSPLPNPKMKKTVRNSYRFSNISFAFNMAIWVLESVISPRITIACSSSRVKYSTSINSPSSRWLSPRVISSAI